MQRKCVELWRNNRVQNSDINKSPVAEHSTGERATGREPLFWRLCLVVPVIWVIRHHALNSFDQEEHHC